MIDGRSTTQAVSAGGVVYRKHEGRLEVVLCGRTGPGTWNLPKGTPNDGETIEETALREVREETGLEVEIEAPLGHIEYWFSRPARRIHKRVYFYLMSERGGAFSDHDPEFDVVEWFAVDEAPNYLTFPTDVDVVRRALDSLESRGGPGG